MNEAAVKEWLEANWSLDLTLAEWWDRLFDAGLAFPSWPQGLGGFAAQRQRSQNRDGGTRRSRRRRATLGQRPEHGRADPHQARHDRAATAVRRPDGPRQAAVVPAVQRAGCGVRSRQPGHARPSATATSSSSPGRRCGTLAPTSANGACCWLAPTPTSPSTVVSRSSCSTCANPASKCARWCR